MIAITSALADNAAQITRATRNGRASWPELAEMGKQGPGSNVFFVAFRKGTVIPEDKSNAGAAGSVNTWPIAYGMPGLRDWLFEQSK